MNILMGALFIGLIAFLGFSRLQEKKVNFTVISMVRNEDHILKRMITSAQAPIRLCDTGSTDGSSRFWSIYRTVHHNWTRSFANNRNLCLSHWLPTIETEFVLLLDADHEVKRGHMKRPQHDMNYISFNNNALPYLIRTSVLKHCHYVGVTHETLSCPENTTQGHYDGLYLLHHADGDYRASKYERDRDLLLNELQSSKNISKFLQTRYTFYLARTFDDLHDYENARHWYKKRTTQGGWKQEIYISYLRLGSLCWDSPELARMYWLKAYETDCNRREALYYLSQDFMNRKDWGKCLLYGRAGMLMGTPSSNSLFVDQSIEQWSMEEVFAFCLFHGGRQEEAHKHWKRMIASPYTPPKVIQKLKKNLLFF